MNKKDITHIQRRPGNRRSFLKSAGLAVLGAPAVMASSQAMPGQSYWWRSPNRLLLMADGFVDPTLVLPPPGPIAIPGLVQPAVRMRMIYPASENRCVLGIQITIEDLVWGLPSPLPDPLPPLPPPGMLLPISFIDVEVTDVTLGNSPMPHSDQRMPAIAFSGKVVANPVPSPFGDLTGAPLTVSAGYEVQDPTTGATAFSFLGAFAAGSHVSICRTAVGTLRVWP